MFIFTATQKTKGEKTCWSFRPAPLQNVHGLVSVPTVWFPFPEQLAHCFYKTSQRSIFRNNHTISVS